MLEYFVRAMPGSTRPEYPIIFSSSSLYRTICSSWAECVPPPEAYTPVGPVLRKMYMNCTPQERGWVCVPRCSHSGADLVVAVLRGERDAQRLGQLLSNDVPPTLRAATKRFLAQYLGRNLLFENSVEVVIDAVHFHLTSVIVDLLFFLPPLSSCAGVVPTADERGLFVPESRTPRASESWVAASNFTCFFVFFCAATTVADAVATALPPRFPTLGSTEQ